MFLMFLVQKPGNDPVWKAKISFDTKMFYLEKTLWISLPVTVRYRYMPQTSCTVLFFYVIKVDVYLL